MPQGLGIEVSEALRAELDALEAENARIDAQIAAKSPPRPRPWHKMARRNQLPPPGDWNIWLFLAGRGFGKLLGMATPIPTPTGWLKIEELSVGDQVFDESGRVCRVTATFDEVATTAYRITFSDGTTLDACGDHQWVTWTAAERKALLRSPYEAVGRFPEEWPAWRLKRQLGRQLSRDVVERALALASTGTSVRAVAAQLGIARNALTQHLKAGRYVPRQPVVHADAPGPQIHTTQEIVDTLTHGKRGDLNHCIPTTGPLRLPDAKLPLDPYVLGCWLGDGTRGSGQLTAHSADQPELRAAIAAAGYETTFVKCQKTVGTRGLNTDLRRAGVSKDKHVPDIYLRASAAQRLALLRGLMDTDGYSGESHVEFCNTNPRLVEAVTELARSLGQKPVVAEGRSVLDGRDCGPKWRVCWKPTIQVFQLRRKADHLAAQLGGAQSLRNHHRMIVKAEPLPAQPMRCITVDSRHSMYLAGEGMIPTHNTRLAAEWLAEQAALHPNTEWAIVAPTWRDCRKVCIEGSSGLLKAFLPGELHSVNASDLTVRLNNGSRIYGYSADGFERIRGSNLAGAWVDEAAVMGPVEDLFAEALMPALRIGKNPRVLITTTPRPIKFLRDLVGRKDGSVAVTRGATWDNEANLSKTAVSELRARYEGTRTGRQELEGELLEDVEGALWSRDQVDATRVHKLPAMSRIVVAVDPAVTSGEKADDTGIIVAGRSLEGHFYIIEDCTMKGTPHACMLAASKAYHRWHADRLVAEVNNGGDYLQAVLQTVDPNIAYTQVRATRGKLTRAEPVAALWEQSRGHIFGYLPTLEDQMCFPAGTLVTTARGDIPVEDVQVGDDVLTRVGWKPVLRSGQTGIRPVITLETELATLACTEAHPVFVEGQGFVPAGLVKPGDIMLTCPIPLSVSASSSMASGTTAMTTTTSKLAGAVGAGLCTGTSGSTTTIARSHRSTTSITRTTTDSTTTRPTLKPSRVLNTSVSMVAPEPGQSRLRSRDVNGEKSGHKDRSASSSARNAVRSFGRKVLGRPTVVASVTAVSSIGDMLNAIEKPHETAVPVYDLTVADQPEFFANGLLVHNCSYTQDSQESPDNLDACIWAATELQIGASAMVYLSAISRICEVCEMPSPKMAQACRSCGAQFPPLLSIVS